MYFEQCNIDEIFFECTFFYWSWMEKLLLLSYTILQSFVFAFCSLGWVTFEIALNAWEESQCLSKSAREREFLWISQFVLRVMIVGVCRGNFGIWRGKFEGILLKYYYRHFFCCCCSKRWCCCSCLHSVYMTMYLILPIFVVVNDEMMAMMMIINGVGDVVAVVAFVQLGIRL